MRQNAMRTSLNYEAITRVSVNALALGVAGITGVFFGYYPARRAARFDPIEALRFE